MERFGFVIHPLDVKRDVARRFPVLSHLPLRWLDFLSGYFPPVYLAHITGIRSVLGPEAEGWLVACPLTPRAMKRFPLRRVYRQIVRAGRLAERLGARIVGLGAPTSAVGDAGLSVAQGLSVPVTTGNSYTVAVTCQSVRCIARNLDKPLESLSVAVLGATGSIGGACSRMLRGRVGHLILVGRNQNSVERMVQELHEHGEGEISGSTDLRALREADVIVSATNAAGSLIRPDHLRTGVVVYDLALPPDVSAAVRALQAEVTVVSGGEVMVPGEMRADFGFGLPPGSVYACMAETIALALEGRYENFTLGREIAPEQVMEIARITKRHGFQPAPLRSNGQLLDISPCDGMHDTG